MAEPEAEQPEEAWSEDEEMDEDYEDSDDNSDYQGGHDDYEEGYQEEGEAPLPPPPPPSADQKSESPLEERSKACMVCTFLNFARASRCTMCRTSFESSPPPAAAGGGSGGESSGGSGGDSGTKSCSTCTSFNERDAGACVVCGGLFDTRACPACTSINGASARACSVCETPFKEGEEKEVEVIENVVKKEEVITITDDDVVMIEQKQSLAPPAPAPAASGESSGSGSQTKNCPSCTTINDPDAGACVVCGSVLPGSGEKACPQCTFLNSSFDYACAICKFPLNPSGSSSAAEEAPALGSRAPAPVPEEYSCLLCFGDFKSASEGYYALEHCRHHFCRACIVRHVGRSLSKLSDEVALGIPCPVHCCPQNNLSRQDIRVLAGYETLQQLDQWALPRIVDSFNKSGYLESFYTTLQMLRANHDALVNAKVPVQRLKATKRRRTEPATADAAIGDAGSTKDPGSRKKTSTKKEKYEAPVLEMMRKLAEEIGMAGDILPYPVTVLLCRDPSLWNLLSWLLRNDSTMEITEHADLYFQAFVLFRAMSSRSELYPLLAADAAGAASGDLWSEPELRPGSLMGLFEKLHTQCSFILRQSGVGLGDDDGDDNTLAMEAALLSEAKHLYEDLRDRVSAWKLGLTGCPWVPDSGAYFWGKFPGIVITTTTDLEAPPVAQDNKGKEPMSDEPEYLRALKLVQFGQAPLLQNHYFRERIDWDSSDVKRTRRISKEIAGLATNLPLQLDSSIHVRVDECRMDLLRALIIGPQGTPYQDGVFLFDIYMGRDYPNSPPQAHFLTTGGGSVRFNPNLYNCGKVCLSLLNTWSGPSWMPGSSTVLQVLVSLQSLVFVSEPFYNEPGYSTGRSYKQMADSYNHEQMYNTLVDSMLPALRQPDPAFEGVIEAHFRLKRKAIEEQCDAWGKLELPKMLSTRHGERSVASMKEAAKLVKIELAAKFDAPPA